MEKMKQYFKNAVSVVANQSAWKVLIFSILLVLANNYFWPNFASKIANHSIFDGAAVLDEYVNDWKYVIITGPLVETLVCQYLLLHLLLKFFKPPICIIVAAILFGLGHFYNPYYFAASFVAGLIFCFLFYIWYYEKGELFNAILMVTAVHGITNAVAYFS